MSKNTRLPPPSVGSTPASEARWEKSGDGLDCRFSLPLCPFKKRVFEISNHSRINKTLYWFRDELDALDIGLGHCQ
jgi:hypothetical protein